MRGSVRGLAATLVAAATTVAACSAPPLVDLPPGPADTVDVAPADVVGPISQRGRHLVDAEGRVVLIHGTNMVNKEAPSYVPLTDGWLGPDDRAQLRRNGWNGVRLGVRPDALMPEPGVVDHGYLERVADAVDALAEDGVWVLLDLHQDVFHGMPPWATTPEATTLPTLPTEWTQGPLWFLQYVSPRSMRQWEDWWSRVPVHEGRSAIDLYGDGVAALAQRFAAEPNVIGIDLLNEPFAGERLVDCVVSTCTDRYAQVGSMYRDLTARVEAVAPGLLVWWAPFNFGAPFQGTPAPGSGVGYTFHSYCLGTDGGEPVQPDAVSNTLCNLLYETNVADAARLSQRWDAPALLGEFGASASPLNTTRLTELADEQLMSWMHWHWGDHPGVVMSHLVRPFAQATAGEPLSQRYDPATGAFELRYRADHSIDAPTSVVVPADAYPSGYGASATGGTITSAPDSGLLTVEPVPGSDEVVVRLERTPAAAAR